MSPEMMRKIIAELDAKAWQSTRYKTSTGRREDHVCYRAARALEAVLTERAELEAEVARLREALKAILHTYDEGGVPLGRAFKMANAALAAQSEHGEKG